MILLGVVSLAVCHDRVCTLDGRKAFRQRRMTLKWPD
jgi:hypothetical protein